MVQPLNEILSSQKILPSISSDGIVPKKGGTSKILIAIIIFVSIIIIGFIYFKLTMTSKIDTFNSNWDNYKCQPSIMPVAGILVGPRDGSVNPFSNFVQCSYNLFTKNFNTAIGPLRKVINSIISILVIFKSSINKIREILRFVRNSMRRFAKDIYMRVKKSYMQIAFIINRIRRIFKYLILTLTSLFDALNYVILTLKSMWKGPMGKIARKLCFDGDTIITINNKQQRIKDCIIEGDIIGILEFSADNVDMYNYKGVIVSGSHIVYENNKPILIADSIYSQRIDYFKDKIFCINTKNNIIMINGIKFSDYEEINDPINMNKELFNKYNTKYTNINNEYNYLHGNTEIKMKNNVIKKIKDITVGDYTINSEVHGIIKVLNNCTLYEFNNDIMTGSQIIKQNNDTWYQICELGKQTDISCKYLYHIMTYSNEIETTNNIITNYE